MVSATHNGETVTGLTLLSEKGKTARIAKPWKASAIQVTRLSDGKRVAARSEGENFRVRLWRLAKNIASSRCIEKTAIHRFQRG